MEINNVFYQYLGLVIFVLFIIYIILKSINYQAKIIEGLVNPSNTDKDKLPDIIKSYTNNTDDALLITKYRKTYENIIINLEDNIGKNVVQLINENAETIAKNPMEQSSQQIIIKINNLVAFQNSLNESMKIVDKH